MQTLVMEISPALAKQMLAKNKENRIMTNSNVDKYVRDMLAGEWRTTHQGILIGKDGAIIDGQHRLTAVVKSNTAQRMMVTRDDTVESAIDLPIDVGYKRATSFILGVDSHHAAIARLAFQYCKNVTHVSCADLKPYSDIIGPGYRAITSMGKTARAKVTTAPLQLAGIARIMLGEDAAYVAATYNAMANLKFEDLPPLPCSFLKQLTIVERRGFNAKQIFSRAFKAFDYDARNRQRMVFQNEELAFNEALEHLRIAFSE